MDQKKIMRISLIVAAVISFLLLFKFDYNFYLAGKGIVCLISIYIIYYILSDKTLSTLKGISILFLGIAVITNPIFPISLGHKSNRQIFDIAAGIVFIATYILLNKDQILDSDMFKSLTKKK